MKIKVRKPGCAHFTESQEIVVHVPEGSCPQDVRYFSFVGLAINGRDRQISVSHLNPLKNEGCKKWVVSLSP